MTAKDRQKNRDRIVTAACNEGRFPRSKVGQYAAMFDADPQRTTVLLTASEKDGGLAKGFRSAGDLKLAARPAGSTAAEDALLEASRAKARGDLRGAAAVMSSAPDPLYPVTTPAANAPRPDGLYDLGSAPAPTPSTSSTLAGAGIEVDAGGHMTCAGLPATVAADGTPRVVTSVGHVTVATLKSLDLDMDTERLLAASRARMPAA